MCKSSVVKCELSGILALNVARIQGDTVEWYAAMRKSRHLAYVSIVYIAA